MLNEIKTTTLSNGETMAYRESGAKLKEPVLIMIHGNQSSSLIFDSLMTHLEKTAHIFAVDLPGFGDSSYNTPHETLRDWADDVALFMKKKKIPSATVLGWSAGGGIAMELAACYPEKVQQLVFSSSVGVKGLKMPGRGRGFTLVKRNPYLVNKEEIAKDPYIVAADKAIAEKNTRYFRFLWDEIIFNIEDPPDPVFDAYVQDILKERCFLDMTVALCQFNITHTSGPAEASGRISDIKCPVTWIHGKQDIVVPFEEASSSLACFETQTELIPIYEAGHAAFIDQPEVFVDILCGLI